MNDFNITIIEKICEIFKKRIISLELKFNEKINVTEEAKKFKVSQTPVRDALNNLVKDGLVIVKPRKGYYVVDLTKRKLNEIYEIRKMMECFALDSLKGKDLSRFKGYYDKALKIKEDITKSYNFEEFNNFDRDLHLSIIQESHNTHLINMFLQIYPFVRISQNIDKFCESSICEIDSLILLLKSMVDNNIHNAKMILTEHIENCKCIGIKSFKKYKKI